MGVNCKIKEILEIKNLQIFLVITLVFRRHFLSSKCYMILSQVFLWPKVNLRTRFFSAFLWWLWVRQRNWTRKGGLGHLGCHTLSPLWPKANSSLHVVMEVGKPERPDSGRGWPSSDLPGGHFLFSLFVFFRFFRAIAPDPTRKSLIKCWLSQGTRRADSICSLLTDTNSTWLCQEIIANATLLYLGPQILWSFLRLTQSKNTWKLK